MTCQEIAILNDKITKQIPPKILEFLRTFPGSFIMGGFILSVIHDTPINDIDLFVDVRFLKESKIFFKDNIITQLKPYWDFKNLMKNKVTIHVMKLQIDGKKIDFVVYNNYFYPCCHIDFLCRMLRYDDGIGLNFPYPECFENAINKKITLNENWLKNKDYGNKYYGLSLSDIFKFLKEPNRELDYWENKLTENLQKYLNKDFLFES